jgi:hypothetical protein
MRSLILLFFFSISTAALPVWFYWYESVRTILRFRMNREPRALNSLSIDIARKGTWKGSIPTGKKILGGIPMSTGGETMKAAHIYRVHLVGAALWRTRSYRQAFSPKGAGGSNRDNSCGAPGRLKMISAISILFLITKSSILTGRCGQWNNQ